MYSKLKAVLLVALLCTAGGALGTAEAQDRQQNVATGTASAEQLLLLMDKDKNGKVSRQEFMDFMAAEFDRLDTNHDGELDVQELTQMHYRPSQGPRGAR